MKKKATANFRNQKKPKKLDGDFQATDATRSGGSKAAKQPAKRAMKNEGRFQPTDAPLSSGPKATKHPAEEAMPPPASANYELAAEQAQAPLSSRVERLLAKKAARKTRKAHQAATATKEEAKVAVANATVPSEAPLDAAFQNDADAGVVMLCILDNPFVARERTAEPNSKEEPFPSNLHKAESDSGSSSTDEGAHRVSSFKLRRRTGRWADDESGEEWDLDEEERARLFDDLDEEERRRLLGEFPDTTDGEGSDWDRTWSEDENDEAIAATRMSGVEPSVPSEPGTEVERAFMANGPFLASRGKSKRGSRGSDQKRKRRRRNKAKKQHVNDDWMTPFSELLIGDASVTPFPKLRRVPAGPAGAASPRAPLVVQEVGQPLLPPLQPLPSSMQPLPPPLGAQPVVPPMPGQPMPAPSMTPALPNVNPTSPAVCIWNSTSPSVATTCVGGNSQNVFTDGSQVYQPVPSITGQPLFTDGKQLYASVCVMFAAPPSSEVKESPLPEPSSDSSSIMDCCGNVDEHAGGNLLNYMATSDEDEWD